MTLHAIEADYFADLRDQNDLLDGLVVTNRLSGELARALGDGGRAGVLCALRG